MQNRDTFGGIFGTIVVVGGSVVGLGNIWRFPYMAGENGGALFIILYFMMSLFISVPIMLSEFTIGRAGQSNSLGSFRKLSLNSKGWQLVGMLGILTAYVIITYYAVIAGWSLDFVFESLRGSMMDKSPEMLEASFSAFVASGTKPVFWTMLFLVLSSVILVFGVTKGIEKANKVFMPLMVIILVAMVANSTTLPGWSEGVRFLLEPDFSKLSWRVALDALGQSFYSMSLGMGAMVVYGSYIKRSENMYRIAGIVALSDVAVAILSGLAIFPAVFTYGIPTTSGPELVFLTLPNIFSQMVGGYYISIAFFILLFFAAITSSVSLLEVLTSFVSDEFKIKRSRAISIVFVVVSITSILCALSQMPETPVKLLGLPLFDFNDKFSAIFIMPLGALLTVIFVGWVLSKRTISKELSSMTLYKHSSLISVTYFMIKYIVPCVILLLFITGLLAAF